MSQKCQRLDCSGCYKWKGNKHLNIPVEKNLHDSVCCKYKMRDSGCRELSHNTFKCKNYIVNSTCMRI